VSADLFRRLGDLEHFNYIKDSGGDMTTHQLYLQSGTKVLNGCDTTTVYALMAGAHGCIWGGANYMPHETVKLYNLVKCGDLAGALELWQKMLPSLLHIWTHDYMQCVLTASHARGYGLGNVRRPLIPLNEAAKQEMLNTLRPLLGEN
jgi:4-hydroxy-tetrahydrodipicolinate synthase